MANIKKNVLQSGEVLYINSWHSGLYTQRSPLFTPVSSQGIQIIAKHDVLADGLNMEVSPNMTLVRRPGYARYCSTQFSSNDYPLAFYSFVNLSGVVKPLVDTPTAVWTFNTTTLTSVFSKSATTQSSFQKVGNTVYICDGNDSDTKKWDGTTASNWGIAAPATAPTLSFGAGALTTTVGYQYVYVFKNSTTGHISTASPASANTQVITSQNITVGGARSTDAQVDAVDIYRTLDGGSLYNFVASIANPGAGTWTYTDSTLDGSLNTDLLAPLSHGNDAPPSGISLVKFHMGRMWVASGNFVYFGAGPDCTNGVPEESFPPANVFKFPSKVTALVSISLGLIVFTSDNAYVIRGSDTLSFYSQFWMGNFGVYSQNSITQDGDLLFIYTSRRQLFQLSDSLDEIGFPIGDKLLAGFDPSLSYLILHRNGTDSGLFIANGLTDIYRYSLISQSWSPLAQPAGSGGVKALGSIEVTVADYRLLAGRTTGSGYILGRNLANFQDDSSSYACNAIVGTLMLAPPGQQSMLNAVMLERMPVGSDATLSVLLNEISGTFTALPNPRNEPPLQLATTSVIAKRHYLKAAQSPLPSQARHMQIKIAFPSEALKNELLGLAIE